MSDNDVITLKMEKDDKPLVPKYISPVNQMVVECITEKVKKGYLKTYHVEVNVDADRIIKALEFDKEQYHKGYIEGFNAGYQFANAFNGGNGGNG